MRVLLLTAFFLLELAALAVFGFWGYQLSLAAVFRILLAVAVPLVIAILWGMFLSPKASVPVFSYPVRTALKLVVFVAASAALYVIEHVELGLIFLGVSILIIAAVFILDLHIVDEKS